MIESIHFQNFKALRDTTLPLGRFTLLVGPNGSGKSTAMQGLIIMQSPGHFVPSRMITACAKSERAMEASVTVHAGDPHNGVTLKMRWHTTQGQSTDFLPPNEGRTNAFWTDEVHKACIYSLQAGRIAEVVQLQPEMVLAHDGYGLVVVLDRLRDEHPERFEALNEELGRWIPEFDRVLFETPGTGQRALVLRTREGQHKIAAADLSSGTLFALAILTLAYLPEPPAVVCLEEPDHGMHPRLLRDVRDAIYRLAYPENFGEKRQPVQVIATTHSPYLLDLFRDHPEEIVIAQKTEDNVLFERLSDREDLDEILQDAHLGDVWYSGVLGGVPTQP